MKLGEVKIEALKIMFVNLARDIGIEDLLELSADETYGSYLVNMPGAINRALSVIERAEVLPPRVFELRIEDAASVKESGSGFYPTVRFDLGTLIEDFYDAARLVVDYNGSYMGEAEYARESDMLLIRNFDMRAEYRLMYHRRVKRVSAGTDDREELDLPEDIACALPYAIKGDLFRDDEPGEAAEARNWFESALLERKVQSRGSRQSTVQTIYGGGMMT